MSQLYHIVENHQISLACKFFRPYLIRSMFVERFQFQMKPCKLSRNDRTFFFKSINKRSSKSRDKVVLWGDIERDVLAGDLGTRAFFSLQLTLFYS